MAVRSWFRVRLVVGSTCRVAVGVEHTDTPREVMVVVRQLTMNIFGSGLRGHAS